jgi:hypothetical protein
MTRARILADYVSSGDELALKAPLASPAFTGTPTGIVTGSIANDAVTGAKIENNPTIAGNLTVSGDLVPSTALSHRNIIINGAMTVKQRGDSHSTEGYGSLDRIYLGLSGGSCTVSQEDFTLGQTDLPSRFRHYMRLNCTTGNNNCGFYHYIEKPSELQGSYVLSFYVKGTNPNGGNFALTVSSEYGTGGSVAVNPYDSTLTVTSSWQRFTIPVTFPSLTGKTINDADGRTGLSIRQPAGDTSTNAWALDITGIQLELGSTATPFEHRSYGEELEACKRYYQEVKNCQTTARENTSTRYRINHSYVKEMRDVPALARTSNNLSFNASGSSKSSSDTTQAQGATISNNCFIQDFGGFSDLVDGGTHGSDANVAWTMNAEL